MLQATGGRKRVLLTSIAASFQVCPISPSVEAITAQVEGQEGASATNILSSFPSFSRK